MLKYQPITTKHPTKTFLFKAFSVGNATLRTITEYDYQ